MGVKVREKVMWKLEGHRTMGQPSAHRYDAILGREVRVSYCSS